MNERIGLCKKCNRLYLFMATPTIRTVAHHSGKGRVWVGVNCTQCKGALSVTTRLCEAPRYNLSGTPIPD